MPQFLLEYASGGADPAERCRGRCRPDARRKQFVHYSREHGPRQNALPPQPFAGHPPLCGIRRKNNIPRVGAGDVAEKRISGGEGTILRR